MGKERLTAFSDAVLAIVMTILVLELDMPSAPTLGALWELRISFFSYALSFFWLGTMWTNLHNEWHAVERVSKSVIWWNLILLFFSSLIPYATSFVNLHFHTTTAQVFYGVVVLAVTGSTIGLNYSLERANENNPPLRTMIAAGRFSLVIDITVKVLGVAAAIWYPPAVMISVLLTMLFMLFPGYRHAAKGTPVAK